MVQVEEPISALEGSKPAVMETKKYVMVKNHVREVNCSENEETCNQAEEQEPSSSSNASKNKKLKKKRSEENLLVSSKSEEILTNSTEISESDIDKLRKVYKDCKNVIKEMEAKYGHLLNLETDQSHVNNRKKRKHNEITSSEDDSDVCRCELKKKIIFDEMGNEISVPMPAEGHICTSKLRRMSRDRKDVEKIEIQTGEPDIDLPDDIAELTEILKNPEITIKYRRQVIHKLITIRQDRMNDLRFNKHSLLEQLKINPDEVFDFKGSNLSTLSGYVGPS